MDMMIILFTLGLSFLLAALLGPICIPLLKRMKFGQQIRTDGPQSHLKKAAHQRWAASLLCWRCS